MTAMAATLGSMGFGATNAYALMVFCLLYTPCSAAVSAVRTETGDGKWTACMAVFQLALAFLAASAVYQTGCLLFPG